MANNRPRQWIRAHGLATKEHKILVIYSISNGERITKRGEVIYKEEYDKLVREVGKDNIVEVI